MSKISDTAARQTERYNKMDAALAGIKADIVLLNETIEKLQNTPGEISAEDQALLDAMETKGDELAAKFAALDSERPTA